MTHTAAFNAGVVILGLGDKMRNPAPFWEQILNYIFSNCCQTTLAGETFNKFSPAADTSLTPPDVSGIGASLIADGATNAPDLESIWTIVSTYPYVRGLAANQPNQLDLYPY